MSSFPPEARQDDRDTRERRIAGALGASLAATLLLSLAVATLLPGEGIPPAVDIIGLASGIASCYLIRRHEIAGWYIGFVMIAASAGSFFAYGLPGQAWFQLLYALPLQIYGTLAWHSGATLPPIGFLEPRQRSRLAAAFLLGSVGLAGILLLLYGGEPLYRLWDAAITCGLILSLGLLARRRIESWYCLIVLVNSPSIALHAMNDAWLYVALYLVLSWNALIGIRDWTRLFRGQQGRESQPMGADGIASNGPSHADGAFESNTR